MENDRCLVDDAFECKLCKAKCGNLANFTSYMRGKIHNKKVAQFVREQPALTPTNPKVVINCEDIDDDDDYEPRARTQHPSQTMQLTSRPS